MFTGGNDIKPAGFINVHCFQSSVLGTKKGEDSLCSQGKIGGIKRGLCGGRQDEVIKSKSNRVHNSKRVSKFTAS